MTSNENTIIITPLPHLEKHEGPMMYNTVSDTAKFCRRMNIGVSESAIRFLCRTGVIPCIRSGNKTLINWEIFMDFLKTGGTRQQQEPQPVSNGIRAIPEKLKR